MRITTTLSIAAAALAIAAVPAAAAPSGPPAGPPAEHLPATDLRSAPDEQPTAPAGSDEQRSGGKGEEPGSRAPAAAKRRAYGRYCKDESKRRVEGEKGTAFSRCVTAMAKLAGDDVERPRAACKGLSKRRVKGEKGTAFSRCVVAANRLREDMEEQEKADDVASEESQTTTQP